MIILRDKQYVESMSGVSHIFYQPYQYAVVVQCGLQKVVTCYWVHVGNDMYREHQETLVLGLANA